MQHFADPFFLFNKSIYLRDKGRQKEVFHQRILSPYAFPRLGQVEVRNLGPHPGRPRGRQILKYWSHYLWLAASQGLDQREAGIRVSSFKTGSAEWECLFKMEFLWFFYLCVVYRLCWVLRAATESPIPAPKEARLMRKGHTACAVMSGPGSGDGSRWQSVWAATADGKEWRA